MRSEPTWLLSPLHFLSICLGPNVLAMVFSAEILAMPHWKIALLILGIDSLFVAGSFLFMQRLQSIDTLWHGKTKRYPGPWRDMGAENKTCMPFQFSNYVRVYFWTGLIVPLAVLGYSLTTPHSAIAASIIPPYVITLMTQLVQERNIFKAGSATWVAVPLHHQVYRFLQSARGLYLVAALQGPQWLTYLVVYLLALWTFNYGSLMTWLTSMYYWHLQEGEAQE